LKVFDGLERALNQSQKDLRGLDVERDW